MDKTELEKKYPVIRETGKKIVELCLAKKLEPIDMYYLFIKMMAATRIMVLTETCKTPEAVGALLSLEQRIIDDDRDDISKMFGIKMPENSKEDASDGYVT